jgi:hypothetical protein
MKYLLTFIAGILIGIYIVSDRIDNNFQIARTASLYGNDQWLALDHAKHEADIEFCEKELLDLLATFENDINACEDAWQSDLAECRMDFAEFKRLVIKENATEAISTHVAQLQQTLDKCEGYLDQCPD